ncbi:hypothetical protein M1O54_05015 [Dehalococcoidia bacterium]|nr:hypothetical protein [Dehalococcoidia bacterium]
MPFDGVQMLGPAGDERLVGKRYRTKKTIQHGFVAQGHDESGRHAPGNQAESEGLVVYRHEELRERPEIWFEVSDGRGAATALPLQIGEYLRSIAQSPDGGAMLPIDPLLSR